MLVSIKWSYVLFLGNSSIEVVSSPPNNLQRFPVYIFVRYRKQLMTGSGQILVGNSDRGLSKNWSVVWQRAVESVFEAVKSWGITQKTDWIRFSRARLLHVLHRKDTEGTNNQIYLICLLLPKEFDLPILSFFISLSWQLHYIDSKLMVTVLLATWLYRLLLYTCCTWSSLVLLLLLVWANLLTALLLFIVDWLYSDYTTQSVGNNLQRMR